VKRAEGRIAEVDEDMQEAFKVRRQLVEGITVGEKDEDGRPRFG
jgi:hypothetical protein